MTKQQILSFIIDIGIVPVVRTSTAEGAIKAIEAIHRGGVRAAEITMTVPGAIRALEKVADQFGDKIVLDTDHGIHLSQVGANTVVTVEGFQSGITLDNIHALTLTIDHTSAGFVLHL